MSSISTPQRRLGRVQPGCVLDHFRETAKAQAGLFFGPDPATHSRCTIGGMLGNNSCGSHSLLSKKHGLGVRMSDNTHSLDVLLYDGTRMHVGPTPPDELEAIIRGGGRRGEIYAALKALVDRYGDAIRQQFPKLERRVSGYNLNDLLPENGFQCRPSPGGFGIDVGDDSGSRRCISSPLRRPALSRCSASRTSTPPPNARGMC